MSDRSTEFLYSLYENKGVVIVNLSGVIDSLASKSIQKLQDEILSIDNFKSIILNFAQVESVDIDGIPAIAQLQKVIRSRPAELRMCSMKWKVKEKMIKSGIVRTNELAIDTKNAIYSLLANKPKTN